MTKAECEKILSQAGLVQTYSKRFWYRPVVYVLHHGEYASPNFFVRHRKHGQFGIKVKYYYYPGTFNASEDHFLTDEELAFL